MIVAPFLTLASLALAVSTTLAHFTLDYPSSRCVSTYLESIYTTDNRAVFYPTNAGVSTKTPRALVHVVGSTRPILPLPLGTIKTDQ
jgi:hypothetical protein